MNKHMAKRLDEALADHEATPNGKTRGVLFAEIVKALKELNSRPMPRRDGYRANAKKET